MKNLVVPKQVFEQIVFSVSATPAGFETGVTLFGVTPDCASGSSQVTTENSRYVVLAVAGPGRRATHQPAHYSGDEDYANAVFEVLRTALPGIRWLGELHVHPRGMTWLSGGDRRTVLQILTGTDDTMHPEEFIAGVMQRREKTVEIYPYHFNRGSLDGSFMEVRIVDSEDDLVYQARLKGAKDDRSRVCQKPAGGGAPPEKTPRHRWLRQWWERARRYGRAVRRGQVHAG